MSNAAYDVVVGRQSIHDANRAVTGYELLFRSVSGAGPAESSETGDQMTSAVFFSALNIGLERLVDDKLLHCNADRGLLTGAIPITLPPERTIIEVPSDRPDAEITDGCRRLADYGYRIALENFRWYAGVEALLRAAAIVKIDVRDAGDDYLADLIRRCRPFGVKMLADKVETEDEFRRCLALGFELFQGYTLSRPQLIAGRALEPGELSRARLAATLLNDDLEIDDLEDILRTEPGLTYQILQIASLGRPRETRRPLRTIREALIWAGTWRVKNWIALLTARPRQGTSRDGIATTLQRARACELLAARVDRSLCRTAFAAGMLSAFDSLLGIPSDELIRCLPLADDLREAAFGTTTELGRIVHDVTRFQIHHNLDEKLSGCTDDELYSALADAFVWANEATGAIDTVQSPPSADLHRGDQARTQRRAG
jgi:EAL and modified HD-GYP domain-containing signal transduction protein